MARQTYRANLSASEIPLLSDFYGRTVVLGKQDMNYIRPNAFSGVEADKNIGIPQAIFVENVMPYSAGFQSIDYLTPIGPTANQDFDQFFYLVKSGQKAMFVPAAGKRYVYDHITNTWTSHAISPPAGAYASVAVLKDRTFTFFKGDTHVYEWDGSTAFNIADPAGITVPAINGVCAANSYLVLWDDFSVYWSSIINPLDCVPSLETGAGSEKVLANKGKIIYCKTTSDGFIIHTTTNSIYARYSGNTRFPWVYTEIAGSANIVNADRVSDDTLDNKLYSWTDQGFMAYDKLKALQVMPTVSEFLGAGKLETYDYVNNIITEVAYAGEPFVKIAIVANRWLVVSYAASGNANPNLLTHALVYDFAFQRWGKLRRDHVDAFEYYGNPTDTGTQQAIAWNDIAGSWDAQVNDWAHYGGLVSTSVANNATPYKNLAFLGPDGRVDVVDFSHTSTSALGIFYLGRFQFVRDKLITCLDVEAEGIAAEDAGVANAKNKLAILTSFDGLNVDKTSYPMLVHQKGRLSRWQSRVTGVNHVLRFSGDFRFSSVQLRTMLNGER